jgi:hypothetical protein
VIGQERGQLRAEVVGWVVAQELYVDVRPRLAGALLQD